MDAIQISTTYEFSREESAAERAEADECDVQLLRSLEDPDRRILDIQREWRVFELHGGDGMDCVSAAQGVRRAFGDADVFHFACPVE